MLRSVSETWSLDEAQKKARAHLARWQKSTSLLEYLPGGGGGQGSTPITSGDSNNDDDNNNRSALNSFNSSSSSYTVYCDVSNPQTPQELKQQLERVDVSKMLLSSTSHLAGSNRGRRSLPLDDFRRLRRSLNDASEDGRHGEAGQRRSTHDDAAPVVHGDDDNHRRDDQPGASTMAEIAEETLAREVGSRTMSEELEVRATYAEVERQVLDEHRRRHQLYVDMHNRFDALMAKQRVEIRQETAHRRQDAFNRAKRDSELLLQLHKMLDEHKITSNNSESEVKKKSEQIFRMAEKAKLEEQQQLRERQKQLEEKRTATSRAKIAELVAKIEQSVGNIQLVDTPTAQQVKLKLLAIKATLQGAKHDLNRVADTAMKEVQAILADYERDIKEAAAKEAAQKAAAAAADEAQQRAEAAAQNAEENLYLRAVQRLKEASERRQEFVEKEVQQRRDILRLVQLTVNKIQVKTNNMLHAMLLIRLFSKDEVPIGVSKTQTVKLSGHREALNYAMHLTAERLLDNVEKLPLTAIKEWLPYGQVIGTIWSASAKFGDIFFDHLVSRCPFVAPVYFASLEPAEASDYVATFLHKKHEDHPRFVCRMAGYARLLGVIMCQKPRWGEPFPADRMWRLLAATLKAEFRSSELADVAAIVVQSLLEASGHVLKATYGQQFVKLVHLMCTEFFGKLQAQPKKLPNVVNLEGFLTEVAAAGGHIAPLPVI